jgi:uncharacterized NAD(P)/FAD-binding protein YdhS
MTGRHDERHLTIIGMGPRGLSILRQFVELAPQLPPRLPLTIHLVDPGETGHGVHSSRQPAYLLTNTVASQVTMFADGHGPSFTEWADAAGYRRFGTDFLATGDGAGTPLDEHDYLPRGLLGEYLSWVFERTTGALPSGIRLVHHRDRAVDVEKTGDGRIAVRLARGFRIRSDFVVLATGHCQRTPTEQDIAFGRFAQVHAARNGRLHYCPHPYPVDRLRRITPDSTVAVQGFGLTAHDVISELTVGRGGCFEGTGAGMRYRPSGREPAIRLFSRQCLPFSARGVNQKGVVGQHKARFFTREAIRTTQGQLDFDAHVWPLLLKEMGYAYRTAQERRHIPPEDYRFGEDDQRAIHGIIDPLGNRTFADQQQFTRFFVDHVTDDLGQAELGNLTSPVKAATDVIRDTRAALREAVEFGGLTPQSHRSFVETYVPLMNRLAFGPPRRRNHELLALIRAGVVGLAGGPGCRVDADEREAKFAIHTDFVDDRETCHVDALVIARLDLFHPDSDRSPLTANLLTRGLVRPFANGGFQPGGIDIDHRGRPRTADGTVLPNVWAIGYVAEGPRFYTYALPRQGMPSKFGSDAQACVLDMVRQIQRRTETGGNDHVRAVRESASVS